MEVLQNSFQMAWNNVLADVVGFLPELISALIILIIGLIVASVVGTAIERLLRNINLDGALQKTGIETYLDRADMKLDSGRFLGRIAYWLLAILVVLAVADILNLTQISEFLRDVIGYFPQLIAAIIILVATLLLANFLRSIVRSSAMSAKIPSAKLLGAATWWIVIIFGLTATLEQLNVAQALTGFVYNLSLGLIALIAIAGGIAFGLGGKEYAADLLERLRRESHS